MSAVRLWHLYLTSQAILRIGADELATRQRDLDDAVSDAVAAADYARWCRWRLMLATERQRRRCSMAERARALVGPLAMRAAR